MTEEVAEVEIVENGEPPAPSTSVVPAPPPSRAEVLAPLDLAEVKGAMEKYQQGLRSLLNNDDWQGQPNADGSFVKKSGWRKIATWFSLSITLTTDETERDEKGQIQRAKVWARATAPNGRCADGDGYCAIDEPRFSPEDDEKRAKARYKLENDLRATAATRAINRAISNLVGMGAVSAEEMEGVERGGGKGFASEAQRNFFSSLLKEAGAKPETVETICSFANATMDGSRNGDISGAIGAMKGKSQDEKSKVARALAAEAEAWQRAQTDVPADEDFEEDTGGDTL